MAKKRDTKSFIDDAVKVHGEKYNYSLVNYVDSSTKVEIICNQGHPNFMQGVNNHLQGRGCYHCGRESLQKQQMKPEEDFIKELEEIHKGVYDYSKVVYKGLKNNITVVCKEHSDFDISPSAHLKGQGCAKCKYVRVGNANRGNLEDSLKDCFDTHGNAYDYSLVTDYNHDREKISVICHTHGVFSVSWNNHKRGRGCPSCQRNGYNKGKPGTFYILVSDNLIKVGITNREVNLRVKSISKSSGKDFKVHTTFFCEDGSKVSNIETQVLNWLKSKYQAIKEVFDGSTECFTDVDLEELLNFVTQFQTIELQSSLQQLPKE